MLMKQQHIHKQKPKDENQPSTQQAQKGPGFLPDF